MRLDGCGHRNSQSPHRYRNRLGHGPGRAGGDGSRAGPGVGDGHTHKRGEGIDIGLTFGVALPAKEPKPTAATSWARTAARRCSTIGELGVSFDTVRNPGIHGPGGSGKEVRRCAFTVCTI